MTNYTLKQYDGTSIDYWINITLIKIRLLNKQLIQSHLIIYMIYII